MRDRRFKSYPRNFLFLWPLLHPESPLSTLAVYCVYVIQNPDGRFYIGMSEDVATRVVQHNSGVSKWTKHRGPGLSDGPAKRCPSLMPASLRTS
jgi:hypothetical protein